jgi:hypothetical protein
MLAKGSVWHRKCYTCNICRKPLDSINACDGHDKEIYCRTCYGKKYGPKGYLYALFICCVFRSRFLLSNPIRCWQSQSAFRKIVLLAIFSVGILKAVYSTLFASLLPSLRANYFVEVGFLNEISLKMQSDFEMTSS